MPEMPEMPEIIAPITDVTVYTDRALITRHGSIHLPAGEHTIRVNNLTQFQHESLRVSGRGPQGTRILNVDITTSFYSRLPEKEVLALANEIEVLQQQYQLLQARLDALEDRRQWLRALGEQSRDFAKGIAQGQMKPQDCADFFRFMAVQAQQDAESAQHQQSELAHMKQEIEAKQRELDRYRGSSNPDRLAVTTLVRLEQEGNFELELAYIVMNASWAPQYDVRVQKNAEQARGEVELTYSGIVRQSTGERWQDVNLALSTARPGLAAIPPDLKPWYLKKYEPPSPPQPVFAAAPMMLHALKQEEPRDKLRATADEAARSASAVAETVEVAIDTATIEHIGTAYLFRAGNAVDIPSDNSPHKTTIALDGLPCEFDYVCAPALEEAIHLRATISNTTERALLKGNASIFLNGEYVGTTIVNMTAPGEIFKIFLGLDDSIKVERKLIERAVDKGSLLQNDLRRTTFSYSINVHNYAPAPRHIIVRDHLPVSQHERLKVKVLQMQPQPAVRTKLELLTWDFTLEPHAEQEIAYRFVVEHPQNLPVVGLP
jgi:uncharacterized protein (TIGR02231 family)